MIWDSQANFCPKVGGYVYAKLHLRKNYLDLMKTLVTDWFNNYWCKGNAYSSTSLLICLWGASKEPNSINWVMSHSIILPELEFSLENDKNALR